MQHLAGTWQQGVGDAWAELGDFVPRLLIALGVFVIGWALAVVLKKVVDLVMERSASHRDSGGAVATIVVRARRSVPRIVHLAVLLVTLWTAIEVIDPGSKESPAADFVDALRGLFLVLGLAGLLTVCAILVVGVGGGLVRPMEDRWEGWLQRMAPAPFSEGDSEEPEARRREPEARGPEVREPEVREPESRPEPAEPGRPEAQRRQTEPSSFSAAPTAHMPTVSDEPAAPEPEESARHQGSPDRAADETQVLPTSTGRRPRP